MKVAIVQLQPEVPNFWEILPLPRYGTPVVATAVRDAGFEVTCLVEDISPDLTDEVAKADVVGFTILSTAADKTYRLADRLRGEGKTIIFGGTHANYFLDDSLRHCDLVVLGDAEGPMIEVLRALEANASCREIAGIAWREDGRTCVNPIAGPQTRFDGVTDIELVKGYGDFLRRHPFAPVAFQATRGCPRGCRFCVTRKMFGGYHTRSLSVLIADLKDKLRYTRNIYFVDNNFAGDLAYTRRLLEAMVEAEIRMNAIVYVCQDFSGQTDLLGMMRQVGFRRILIGVESFRDDAMRTLGKEQSFRAVRGAVAALKRHGFKVSGSFIMGDPGETAESAGRYLRAAEDLGLDYAYFFVFCVYPEQCGEMIGADRVFFDDYRYGSGHFVTFFGDHVRPSVLQRILADAYLGFYSRRRLTRKIFSFAWRDALEIAFHRSLAKHLARAADEYRTKLEELERGLYDGDSLIPSAVAARSVRRLEAYDNLPHHQTRVEG